MSDADDDLARDIKVGPGLAITDQCDCDEIEAMREAGLTVLATIATYGASASTIVCVARALFTVDLEALQSASDTLARETNLSISEPIDLGKVFVYLCDEKCKAIESARAFRDEMPVAS